MTVNVQIRNAEFGEATLVWDLVIRASEEYWKTLIPPPGILAESVVDVVTNIERGGAVLAFDGDVAVRSARFHPTPD